MYYYGGGSCGCSGMNYQTPYYPVYNYGNYISIIYITCYCNRNKICKLELMLFFLYFYLFLRYNNTVKKGYGSKEMKLCLKQRTL